MNRRLISTTVALSLCAGVAMADTKPVLLLIENKAGAVTQVSGLTEKDCEAVKLLLQPAANDGVATISSGNILFLSGTSVTSAPSTSDSPP